MYLQNDDLAGRSVMGEYQALLRWLRRVLPQRSVYVEPVAEWALSSQTLHRVHSAEVSRITCLEGTVWLTIEGQLNDVILTPGQSHLLLPKESGLLAGAPTCRVPSRPAGRPRPYDAAVRSDATRVGGVRDELQRSL